MAPGRCFNPPQLPCSKNNTPPTLPSIYTSIYTEGEITRERECVYVQWAASHSDTPTHTPNITKPTRAAGSETHARVTDRLALGWSDLFFTFFFYLPSTLLCSHFVFLRGMQNRLRSVIEHCLFAYAICIVLVHRRNYAKQHRSAIAIKAPEHIPFY